ncbi:hypothetical protein HWV62_18780 [Athelia sp. TMB]|nr:hypothetical protein HWV62_36585 [Athelia sp. TMB]KAF7972190.1 hypothetical protein HWV62_18780 [Athelia sp. TMB]
MAKRKMGGDPIDFIGLPLPRHSQSTSYPEASAQRRRRRPPTVAVGPSSGVLSLLATISAATYPVEATSLVSQPTPPPFLCPSIIQEGNTLPYGCTSELVGVASSSSSSVIPSPTAPPSSPRRQRRGSLADRFEKGPDGQWRRVDKYTIYGSTVCISCSADGNGATTSSATTSTAVTSSTPTVADQYDVDRPSGWSAPTPIDTGRLKLILSVSLVLSFVICMLMIGVTLYRRQRRRKILDSDEEIKLRRRKGGDVSDHEALMEQAARVKQKFWTLSTARWKASVRSSARRRRNWRKHTAAHSMKVSEPSIPEAPATSRPSSPAPSESTRASVALDRASTPIPDTPRPMSPPAYIHPPAPPLEAKARTVLDPISDSSSSSSFINDDYDNHNEPAYTGSISNGELPISYHDSSISHPPAAHVATDDKTLLAQMADMASAPPSLDNDEDDMQISAPAWQDEEIASFSAPASPRASTSAIPPPPSHVKTSGFYEYAGDATLEVPEADLPSAPPSEPELDHGASAPPLEGHAGDEDEDLPSAPPLQPSAPGEWDWIEQTGQSHDRHSRTLSSSTLEFLPLPLYQA